MPRKAKPTGKTKLGMDKKYLNEDIYIYQNPEVESRNIVEPEVIEKYTGIGSEGKGSYYIKDNIKPKKTRAIIKIRKTFEEKIKNVQIEMSNDKKYKIANILKNKENTHNPRYFPLKSKYELQLISEILKTDRQYLEYWYEHSYDKESERNRYVRALLDGNAFMFQFSDENE